MAKTNKKTEEPILPCDCVGCVFWKDKRALQGEEWKGIYFGRCTKFSMETPPLYACKHGIPKSDNE